jgi:demethylmenaquinone methyltransferase/2-methoxy-6-polyprenyl-1,4-benzoquinol methylase
MRRVDPATKSGTEVRRMFDAIAPRYDLLNRVLSAGSDVRWRRRAVERALAGHTAERPADVLDVCCGTADLALAFGRDGRTRRVTGFDFSRAMVRIGMDKPATRRPRLAVADALRLPVRDASFDVASVAFGLRNLVEPERGIAELARVVRPGGRVAILEFFRPAGGAGARLFRWYFKNVLPRVGRWLTRGSELDAYRYLPDSVDGFAPAETVGRWCERAGFESVEREPFLFGSVVLVTARRQAACTVVPRREAAPACVA